MSAEKIISREARPAGGNHFDALDGMRGIAILMVVCYHTLFTNPGAGPASRFMGFVFKTGWMGVPLFFVLSGFLISFPFFRQRQQDLQSWYVKGYSRRRAAKIIPPYCLSIAIIGTYCFLRFSNPAYLTTGLKWALGISNFIRPVVSIPAPYWSLLVETHFYILLPLFFLLFRGLRPRPASLCIFALLLLVPPVVRQYTWPAENASKDLSFLMDRFPCALDYFGWGVLFAGFFVESPVTGGSATRLRYFGYAGMLLLATTLGVHAIWDSKFYINTYPSRWSTEVFHFLPALSCFLLLFFLFDADCLGSRFFAWSPLRFIGIVSYEWFLFHQAVVLLFREALLSVHGSILLYLFSTAAPLLLTFVFSVAVYRYFSFPILQWGRNRPSRQSHKTIDGAATPTTTYVPPTSTEALPK
jgi:peptidoglycan/LPS O-acetylase OafA/YrhL